MTPFSLDIPVIETERLRLRGFLPRDFAAVAAYRADPAVMAFSGGPENQLAAWKSFAAMIGHWCTLGFGYFCIADRADDRCIGQVGLQYPPLWPGREVTYTLAHERQGRGLATEAVSAALWFAYSALQWPDAISLIAADNLASRRVAEKMGAARDPEPVTVWGHEVELWRHRSPDVHLKDIEATRNT